MHPIITRDLMKARTSDLHRQAERDALSRAARRARHAPAKHSPPFRPAHPAAALIRRVSPCSVPAGPGLPQCQPSQSSQAGHDEQSRRRPAAQQRRRSAAPGLVVTIIPVSFPEVTSITAFTVAAISISTFGIGSSKLVEQSVLGGPAGPSGLPRPEPDDRALPAEYSRGDAAGLLRQQGADYLFGAAAKPRNPTGQAVLTGCRGQDAAWM